MERKRKLPARAAARVEHVSKKRNSTPPDAATASTPSSTLPSPQPAEPVTQEQPLPSSSTPAALPKSLQPGHPLPTVEKPQSDDLSQKEFQSVQESGVIAESLSRSRQKWIHDGVFEKYWTKPTKRKGVVKEDSNNPAKDTMTKIGQVTITVEPHLLEATMYAVKDPKPAHTTLSTFRPIMQYGPPNGTMPPPNSTATSAAAPVTKGPHSPVTIGSPSKTPIQTTQTTEKLPTQPLPSTSVPPAPMSPLSQQRDTRRTEPSSGIEPSSLPGRDLKSVLAAPQSAQAPVPGPGPRPSQPPLSQPHTPSTHPLHAPNPAPGTMAASLPPPTVKATPPPPKPASSASGADPIIVTLAERASEDPHLRDLMKRVAVGEAASHELAHFQRIIDQITQDYKKKGGQQGPSAERLMVEGKTVKYFADEVRTILEIVLASNPKQRSSDLRPPPGSDPLVILLVKETLDRPITKALVLRVAEGKMKFTDAQEMKSLLERLQSMIKQDAKANQATATSNVQSTAQSQPAQTKVEAPSKKSPTPSSTVPQNAPASQQALRSKGPPPPPKPDIAAIVLEFAGGTGDRYLFPKYSILEYSADGTEVVASFLIVRRGSKLEYGGDRALDYYQPVTLRLHSQTPKILENLARVVAPEDEVRRYMDDVMENMTRAEYVLLAMRLPKSDKEDPIEERPDTPKISESSHPALTSVLWNHRPTSARPTPAKAVSAKPVGEDEQYQSFIASVS
ncbi:hypothetical protein F4679DRAFT_545829 [Xylaria curta]|nr:hypothetical protein F4679DRAFT_545829 [Xylaria curta]